jgi:hypothetical protein
MYDDQATYFQGLVEFIRDVEHQRISRAKVTVGA